MIHTSGALQMGAGCAVLLLLIGAICQITDASLVVTVAPGRLAQVEARYRSLGYLVKQKNARHRFLVVEKPGSSASPVRPPVDGDIAVDSVTAGSFTDSSSSLQGPAAAMSTWDTGAGDANSPAEAAATAAMPADAPIRRAPAATDSGVLSVAGLVSVADADVERVEKNVQVVPLGRWTAMPQQRFAARALKASTTGSCPITSMWVGSSQYNGLDPLLGKAADRAAEVVPYGVSMVEADNPTIIGISKNSRKKVMWCIIDTGLDRRNTEFDPESTSGCLPGAVRPDNTTHDCRYKWYQDDDSYGHGTHTSGTIAARRNGKGVVGVSAEGAYVYHYNVFGDGTEADYTDFVTAWYDCLKELDYRKKATATPDMKMVVSMSVGGEENVQAVSEALADISAERTDVLFVAAAGNGFDTVPNYPAADPAVVAVASVNKDEVKSAFSSYYPDVEWAAPGDGTLSTAPLWLAGGGPGGSGFSLEQLITITPFTPPTDYPDVLTTPPLLPMGGSAIGNVSGQMVDCGIGDAACANATGKLCLMQRGGGPLFCEKVLNCLAGGGKGVLIYGKSDSPECEQIYKVTLTGTSCATPSAGWPVVLTATQKQGLVIKDFINSTPTAVVALTTPSFALQYLSGTSMATPTAAGVAGLVWSAHPECTSEEIRAAISASSKDKGTPGRDDSYGYGIVKAFAAHNYLQAHPCGDCIGNWSDWSDCDKPCGGGVQTSAFVVTRPALSGAKPCEAAAGTVRNRTCNVNACVVRAVNDAYSAQSGRWLEMNLLGNDGQTGGVARITVSAPIRGGKAEALPPTPARLASNGSTAQPLQVDGASARYLSRAGFIGVDKFNYTVFDTQGGSSTATVTVRVGAGSCDDSTCTLGSCDATKGRCLCSTESGMRPTFISNPNAVARQLTPMVPACRLPGLKAVAPFSLQGSEASKSTTVAVGFNFGQTACFQLQPAGSVTVSSKITCPSALAPKLPKLTALANATPGLVGCTAGQYTYAVQMPQVAGCYRLILQLQDGVTRAAVLRVV